MKSNEYISRTGEGSQSSPRNDGWRLWPILFAFLVPLVIAVSADLSWDKNAVIILIQFFLILIYLVVSTLAAVIAISYIIRFQWKKFLSYIVLPLFCYMQLIYPRIRAADVSKYAYFFYNKEYYEKKIAETQESKPLLVWFFWKDASPMSGEVLYYIVFDESDGFSRPGAMRSVDWRARAEQSYLAAFGYPAGLPMPDQADHLFGHYYVVILASQ